MTTHIYDGMDGAYPKILCESKAFPQESITWVDLYLERVHDGADLSVYCQDCQDAVCPLKLLAATDLDGSISYPSFFSSFSGYELDKLADGVNIERRSGESDYSLRLRVSEVTRVVTITPDADPGHTWV